MKKSLKCIMLVDDDADDNFIHEREIKKNNPAIMVITKNNGREALEFLKSNKDDDLHPDLIFLDINMPAMNGWQFLEEYKGLDEDLQCKAVIIMLTTSQNPDDIARANAISHVCDYITKPLSKELIDNISEKYFHKLIMNL